MEFIWKIKGYDLVALAAGSNGPLARWDEGASSRCTRNVS